MYIPECTGSCGYLFHEIPSIHTFVSPRHFFRTIMLNQGVVVSKFGPWGKNGVCCCALEPNFPFGLNGLKEKYKKFSQYIFLQQKKSLFHEFSHVLINLSFKNKTQKLFLPLNSLFRVVGEGTLEKKFLKIAEIQCFLLKMDLVLRACHTHVMNHIAVVGARSLKN